MNQARIAAVALAGLTLTACAGDPYGGAGPRENTGTLIGAVSGALIGSQIGGGTAARVGAAAAGAVIGGLIGNRIGQSLDARDRRMAYAAENQALRDGPPGAPVGWRNPQSGHYGTVVPGPSYDRAGDICREFTHTIYINGRPESARGTACRNPDGTWSPVG